MKVSYRKFIIGFCFLSIIIPFVIADSYYERINIYAQMEMDFNLLELDAKFRIAIPFILFAIGIYFLTQTFRFKSKLYQGIYKWICQQHTYTRIIYNYSI